MMVTSTGQRGGPSALSSLRDYLDTYGAMPAWDACRLASHIAQALGQLHEQRGVHGNLRPENIGLEHDGAHYVVRLNGIGEPSASDEMHYLAPELVHGASPNVSSDLYALGIVLYEMLCGVTPFAGQSPQLVAQAHLTRQPVRPAGFDDQVWNVVEVLTAKTPLYRPASAEIVANRLEHVAPRPPLAPEHIPTPPEAIDLEEAEETYQFEPTKLEPVGHVSRFEATIATTEPTQPVLLLPEGGWGEDDHSGQEKPASRRPLMVAVSALSLIVVALLSYLVLGGRGLPATQAQQPTNTARSADSAQPVPSAEQQPQQSASPEVTPSASPSNAEPVAWPEGTRECSATVAASRNTSCEFATNVATQWASDQSEQLRAYSPVTAKWYELTCEHSDQLVVCRGGVNAAIYLRP